QEIRSQERLLASEQVRLIREKQKLTQAEMERLLGIGPKTYIRWERGTVFQNRTADALLRVIDAVPGAVEFLAAMNGLQLERPARASEQDRSAITHRAVRYALPTEETRRRGKVLTLSDFRSEEQTAEIHLESETPLPAFKVKAMR